MENIDRMKYEISKENIEKIFDTKQIDRWIPYVAIEKDEENDTLKIVYVTLSDGNIVPKAYINDKIHTLTNVFELINYKEEGGWNYFEY